MWSYDIPLKKHKALITIIPLKIARLKPAISWTCRIGEDDAMKENAQLCYIQDTYHTPI